MVIEKAKELAKALYESPEYKHMLDVRTRMENDAVMTGLIKDFTEKRHQIADMLSQENMDDAAVKALSADVERIQDEMNANELFKEMMTSQTDFTALMNEVNMIISKTIGIGGTNSAASSACSGSCSTCGGGCH